MLFYGRSVFWALFGAIYLCFGLPEVYRVLFEVFGMDPDAEDCQPRLRRQLEDVDYVSAEFEGKLNWQDIVAYKASFTYLLFRVLLFIIYIKKVIHLLCTIAHSSDLFNLIPLHIQLCFSALLSSSYALFLPSNRIVLD